MVEWDEKKKAGKKERKKRGRKKVRWMIEGGRRGKVRKLMHLLCFGQICFLNYLMKPDTLKVKKEKREEKRFQLTR